MKDDERDLLKRLRPGAAPKPPAGLLEKLKRDIPERRGAKVVPFHRRIPASVLRIAALLFVASGALFVVWHAPQREAPPGEPAGVEAPAPRAVEDDLSTQAKREEPRAAEGGRANAPAPALEDAASRDAVSKSKPAREKERVPEKDAREAPPPGERDEKPGALGYAPVMPAAPAPEAKSREAQPREEQTREARTRDEQMREAQTREAKAREQDAAASEESASGIAAREAAAPEAMAPRASIEKRQAEPRPRSDAKKAEAPAEDLTARDTETRERGDVDAPGLARQAPPAAKLAAASASVPAVALARPTAGTLLHVVGKLPVPVMAAAEERGEHLVFLALPRATLPRLESAGGDAVVLSASPLPGGGFALLARAGPHATVTLVGDGERATTRVPGAPPLGRAAPDLRLAHLAWRLERALQARAAARLAELASEARTLSEADPRAALLVPHAR